MQNAKVFRRSGHADAAAGLKRLHRTYGWEHDGYAHGAAQQLRFDTHRADVVQNARLEHPRLHCRTVAPQACLGIGRTDQVIPIASL